MRDELIKIGVVVALIFGFAVANAQGLHRNTTVPEPTADTLSWYSEAIPEYELAIDRADFDSIISNPSREVTILPTGFMGEPVFDRYRMLDSLKIEKVSTFESPFPEVFTWLDDLNSSTLLVYTARQNYMIDYPWLIRYNIADLPEPPKQYRAVVNPVSTRIEFEEMKVEPTKVKVDITPKRWLGRFSASLQFSQAYISPNWYQGGNNNLNMLIQAAYNLKLNRQLYQKYLFEMTVQYKLGLNSTPDDSIRSYNISEDLFQFNLTAGLKAARNWFYSGTINFKTQLFNSYPLNSRNMKASLLSPGELNIGLGMTYNRSNAKKTFTFGLSMSPLSWNLKTCINNRVDETAYGIKPGRNTVNEVGSSLECNLMWKLAYNIVYTSRLFAFSDYDYMQSDWEHTIDFTINRYLSTRFYLHLRYDSSTPRVDDTRWHKLQLKEILSFGFNYTFGVG